MILKGCQAVPQNYLIDKLDLHFLSQTEKTDIILKKNFQKLTWRPALYFKVHRYPKMDFPDKTL